MRKLVLGALAALSTLAIVPAAEARSRSSITIHLGSGGYYDPYYHGGYYDYRPRYYRYYDRGPRYYRPHRYYRDRIRAERRRERAWREYRRRYRDRW